MTRIKKILLFMSFCFGISSYGQQKSISVVDVLKKSEQVLKSQKYISYNTKYTLYHDYNSNKIYEQYNGIFLKKGQEYYVKIKNTEFIADEKYGLKINSDEKAIQISNATSISSEESPLSVTNYLTSFENRTLKSDKDYYICELKPNKISQIMLSKVIIYIKKSDFSVAKQQLYYVEKMESKDSNGKKIFTTPRLEITFANRKADSKKDDLLLKRDNYFTLKGEEIIMAKKYNGYKLFKS